MAALLCAYGGRLVFKEMGAFHTAVASWSLPRWVGFAAAWSLLAGGALLGVGFLTRIAALLCGAVVALVMVKTHLHGWQMLDPPLAGLLFGACLSLLLSGAGRVSIDRRLFGGT